MEQLHEQQLLNVVADLCRLILHEVIHVIGYFVHPKHDLATQRKYEGLCRWDAQHLYTGSSSANRGIGQKYVFYAYFDDVL
jgi:hypothetical protein